jgi:HEAT repeat protein
MIQKQSSMLAGGLQRNIRSQAMSRRLFSCLFISITIVLLLTLLEMVFVFVSSPAHTVGGVLNTLFGLLARTTSLLLLPCIELVALLIIVWLVARPIALLSYLRTVRAAQAQYHQLYTPLKALTNTRRITETAQKDTGGSAVLSQEELISILELVQEEHSNILILGVPGAGKTIALRAYQYEATQHSFSLVLNHGYIPVYVPMKNYSLFLKEYEQYVPEMQELGATESPRRVTILDFLYASDLPGMRHLRNYLSPLSKRGRLLLLCDGLNEVDSNYLTRVSEELAQWMRDTRNRLIITCREIDYREQRELEQLVNEGYALKATIYPLTPEQVNEFVERYVERQDKHWRHTAGQIMQVIDRSRLRYHCTNPMLLFTLMGIIDTIGVERGKQLDTRGRLLNEYVAQSLAHEQQQPHWKRQAPSKEEVINFLSELACAARWANDRNAIQLRHISSTPTGASRNHASYAEIAVELQYWLDEHPARGPFEHDSENTSTTYDDLSSLLQFAHNAELIEISPGGVLSFRHELIAEYFVAHYFFISEQQQALARSPIREELLDDVGRWSEPIALWAGLHENPLELAERFGASGLANTAYVLPALALGLICVGVLWAPPQVTTQQPVALPPAIEESLSVAVRNKAAREELARIFTRCAEEGGQEVYRSLLPLITVDGVDELLVLLDQNVVPALLFTQLQDTIDDVDYEPQVKRITRVLGRFGGDVAEYARELSLPGPGKSPRLRAAAINILGGTRDARAVRPLIERLSDTENVVAERATNALIRLGPDLTLAHVIEEVKQPASHPLGPRIHFLAIVILERFLTQQDVRKQLSLAQYRRVIDALIPVLAPTYQSELEVQRRAMVTLVHQGRHLDEASARDNRWEYVIKALLSHLGTQNETLAHNITSVLQSIGAAAVPFEIEQLNQTSEIVCIRIIEIFKEVRDMRALPRLLALINSPSTSIQQQVASALAIYTPDSISGLIDLVLTSSDEHIAEQAAQILGNMGEQAVEPITFVLFNIVPGRTRLLVQILAQLSDTRCIPALVTLLQTPEIEPLLAITIVRALGQFADKQTVPPLLSALSSDNPHISEEAIDALSRLGPAALEGLVAALDTRRSTPTTARVERAILGMRPFPGEQLIALLEQCSEAQAQHIMYMFKAQGADAALALVHHLQHPDEPIRDLLQQTLLELSESDVVPALLEALYQPELRSIACAFLLKYPDEAIPSLVGLIGDGERGNIAVQLLPRFGVRILRPLISALDDQRETVRDTARRIIIRLVRRGQDTQATLRATVELFSAEPPEQARDTLLRMLTDELADMSLPALLESLEDAHLVNDAADALVLLSRKSVYQQPVIEQLIEALYMEGRRYGALAALARIGAPAVIPIGNLITDPNPAVAKIAREVLREIGAPALSFIWKAYSDGGNPARREAAMEIFHTMRTDTIKDGLIARLASNRIDDIAMAVSLLLDRVYDEAQQQYADQSMIQVLVEYVQTHDLAEINLRVIALLLLLGDIAVVDQFIQTLDEYPQQHKQLLYALLLLGEQAQEVLHKKFLQTETSVALRAEIATILGMTSAPESVLEYVQNIARYGIQKSRTLDQQRQPASPDDLNIALHALGGLLAGGVWDVQALQELRDTTPKIAPSYDLYSVLLGARYTQRITQLEQELQDEQDKHKQVFATLSERILADQERIEQLDQELAAIKREHSYRGDELQEALHKNQTLQQHVNQLNNEKDSQGTMLEQLERERNALQAKVEKANKEIFRLNARLNRTLEEKELLAKQNDRLIQQIEHPNSR